MKRFLKIFFETVSMHGFGHIMVSRRHPFESFFWVILVIAAIFGAIFCSHVSLSRFFRNPTVITMERNYLAWNTSFPAATICPKIKISEERLENYIEKYKGNTSLLREFLWSLAHSSFDNFDEVVYFDGIASQNYMDILLDLQFEFRPTVTNSGPHPNRFGLTQIISEMGICYGFNSNLAIYNSRFYWTKGLWDLVQTNESMFVNVLDGGIFVNVVNMNTGFDLYIHGPNEVADVASKKIYSPNGYFLQVFLSGLTLFSSDNIRNLRVNQRKCRFYDESNLRHSPVYSYILCRMDCRASLAKKLCGCTPHFYRKLDVEKICNVSGLHCLANYKERLILLKGECNCLPNCNQVNYVVEGTDKREWFLGSNLQWGLSDHPKMRLRRDIIFGFSHLLVHIGGMAGLFLGCSVLSFIEIIYFFTLRLYWFIAKN